MMHLLVIMLSQLEQWYIENKNHWGWNIGSWNIVYESCRQAATNISMIFENNYPLRLVLAVTAATVVFK